MARLRKLEDLVQLVSSLALAIWVAWSMWRHAYPLVNIIPAAILTFCAGLMVWVFVWFLRRKFTYQQVAKRNRADLAAGGDGWPRHRRHE